MQTAGAYIPATSSRQAYHATARVARTATECHACNMVHLPARPGTKQPTMHTSRILLCNSMQQVSCEHAVAGSRHSVPCTPKPQPRQTTFSHHDRRQHQPPSLLQPCNIQHTLPSTLVVTKQHCYHTCHSSHPVVIYPILVIPHPATPTRPHTHTT